MPRPLSLLPVVLAAAFASTLLALGIAPPAGATRVHHADTEAPLAVSIDSLSPSAIPKSGYIRLTGTVTNRDASVWSAIKLYAFISGTPMTTSAEIVAATKIPESTEVGSRIIDLARPQTQFTIDTLAPGSSAPFSLAIPRADLQVTESGVYWFGVHALGENADGRVDGADGRARTFLPLVPSKTTTTVDTALVVPVRHAVQHEADGRISDLSGWTDDLSAQGQLRSLVDFGAAAGDRPLTWLVDPAVTDAATRITQGNPARSLAPTINAGEADGGASESASPEPSADPPESAGTASSDADGGDLDDPTVAAAAAAAGDWLARLHTGLEGREILGLPYGDLDVSAAAAHDPDAYAAAQARSGTTLAPWGLPLSPAVAAPAGYLSASAVRMTVPGTRVLVTDRMFRGRAPAVARTEGHTVVVASSGAASGGPGPDDAMAPVAVRQRIVSEAALRLLTAGQPPLVVVLPSTWAPASSPGFFEGLDLDWLHLTTVGAIASRPGAEVAADGLKYPAAQSEAELDAADFAGADGLARSGDILQNLLTLNDEVGGVVRDEAMTDLSYASRRPTTDSQGSAAGSRSWIEQRLRSVKVSAPPAVILSSGSGRFSATISNGLDEPVTVHLEAETEPLVRVSVPRAAVAIPAGARNSVLLHASSKAVGVRNATLQLTDIEGTPIGSSDSLPIRSNRVSNVIWVILGIGIALLFGTIVIRLFRRIRAAARS